MSGKRRENILRRCPEDFREELSDWIDEIESEVMDIADLLEINGTEELDDIDTAKGRVQELARELY